MLSKVLNKQALKPSGAVCQQATRGYKKVLSSVPRSVLEMEYAVRGQIPIRGEQIQREIKAGKGSHYKFDRTTPLNIGNPQQCGQKHVTFNREVISGMLHP